MVPADFPEEEIRQCRDVIINFVYNNYRIVNNRVLGDQFLFYERDIARPFGYHIESEADSHNIGILVGSASILEFDAAHALISCVVVNEESHHPGRGFFELGNDYGLFILPIGRSINPDGVEELTFWSQQVEATARAYGRHYLPLASSIKGILLRKH